MKISYGITVHNESNELNTLLEILVNNIDEEDEIIICDDYSDRKTKDVIEHCIAKIRQFTEGFFHNDFLEGAKNKQLVKNESLCKNVEFLSEFLPYMHQYNGSSIVIIGG